MNAQRFVLVTGDFVPTGGMDRANYALASYIARTGHSVTLVAHRVAPELAALSGVTVHVAWKPFGSHFLGQWPLSWAGKEAGTASGSVVVNGGNCPFPDVNWVHYVHAAYRPVVMGSPLRRVKNYVNRPLDLRAESTGLRIARLVVCNSELTRRNVTELCGVSPQKAVVVYYGTDPQRFYPATTAERNSARERFGWDAKGPVVLFIGALGDRRKGFDTLFEAWVRLCKNGNWDGLLVVVGAGAEKSAWQRRATDAGLEERIQFLGFRTDVPDLLRAADALVSPTRYEAYGLGVHEALCCGLPALVSASAGVAERYLPEMADLLLPDADDAADLAARLMTWRNDQEIWKTRVAPLSKSLLAYTWDDMARKMLAAIASSSMATTVSRRDD